MGQLVDGTWHDVWYDTTSTGGAFERTTAKFRNWITADGAAGPTGEGGFPAVSGRYHLYVSYACPWAHRTLIFRALKGLEAHISISAVHPDMLSEGWTFETDAHGATGDTLYGLPFARDIYLKADPQISGRVTVPILWDKERETIVSNESSEIIRMLNSAFDGLTGNRDDYGAEPVRSEIEEVNARIYDTLNNGVYKAGFATTQAAYDAAVADPPPAVQKAHAGGGPAGPPPEWAAGAAGGGCSTWLGERMARSGAGRPAGCWREGPAKEEVAAVGEGSPTH
nr:hypothetical protein [Roseobacter sp.]